MLPDDLLKTADALVRLGSNKPKQADLRRAISTVYYAMFHTLARCCADGLVGTSGAKRSKEAWLQVYRALEHGLAKNACKNKSIIEKFPVEIQDFASLFIEMQTKRHNADYNPNERFYKSSVTVDIDLVKSCISKFNCASLKDRRAFAVFVIFKPPRP